MMAAKTRTVKRSRTTRSSIKIEGPVLKPAELIYPLKGIKLARVGLSRRAGTEVVTREQTCLDSASARRAGKFNW